MTKRHASLPPDAEAGVDNFIEDVDERLTSDEETCDVVQDTLVDLFGDRKAYQRWLDGEDVSPAERVRLQGHNPCNATLESEYYGEKNETRFERSKHLQWLWRQFDATPMADNIDFALRFRRMLAEHLFDTVGEDCRFFKGITFTYGHNIRVGDNVVVHDDVHLDDRGTLEIGNRVSISDSAHVLTHDHDIVDQTEVKNYRTIIEDDARLTYDTLVRAGSKLGKNSVVGAKAIVDGDVPAHHVAVGQPAKSVRVKPGWESEAAPVADRLERNKEGRQIEYDLPEDLDAFDEFKRDLHPPTADDS